MADEEVSTQSETQVTPADLTVVNTIVDGDKIMVTHANGTTEVIQGNKLKDYINGLTNTLLDNWTKSYKFLGDNTTYTHFKVTFSINYAGTKILVWGRTGSSFEIIVTSEDSTISVNVNEISGNPTALETEAVYVKQIDYKECEIYLKTFGYTQYRSLTNCNEKASKLTYIDKVATLPDGVTLAPISERVTDTKLNSALSEYGKHIYTINRTISSTAFTVDLTDKVATRKNYRISVIGNYVTSIYYDGIFSVNFDTKKFNIIKISGVNIEITSTDQYKLTIKNTFTNATDFSVSITEC